MININNSSKAVKVLKAFGKKDLRIFPGNNAVDISKEGFEQYSDSEAAKAMISEFFKISGFDKLSDEEKELALEAKRKNDELNKSKKVIEKQQKDIKKLSDKLADLEKVKEENAELKEMVESLKKEMKDMQKVMMKKGEKDK